ncbi:MAG TPA: hypothetical protein VNM69_00530 [Bacillus sp. (in: firmicutes)]|uniref:hypothetical protein n=1 Tax=Bacillus litorisediminis TaxID=2922713 RepID=UPI001FAF3D06|nr:hypothetical protein [Bacillus litorisediminis]HWO74381.1 hypothetical protein [Bacillus sp. (in: firmicutes)]
MLTWIGSDGQVDVDKTHEFNEETARLREYFLAKGLPQQVVEVCANYEWDDDVVAEMLTK